MWEPSIEREKGVTSIFQNRQQQDKKEILVNPIKPDKQWSGRLGKRLKILHSGLSHGTLTEWTEVFICEFVDTVSVSSVSGANNAS